MRLRHRTFATDPGAPLVMGILNASPESFSDGGDYRTVDTQVADTTPPTAPSGLTASAASFSEVDLSWLASSDPDGGGVAGYVVSRNGTAIATLGA